MFPSILIVDDEPFILKSLEGLLADEGFETITARNGYEALKIISSESPTWCSSIYGCPASMASRP